ncbi:MAG: hypothetical protein FJZ59_06830 [Chlamydiae bacterium]|jgi:hypothetical protein|nr:hypothetical protein [Chlamydiota bacterium]
MIASAAVSRLNSTYNFPKERRVDKAINFTASLLFQIGAYLTDPICKAHEFYAIASVTEKTVFKIVFIITAVALLALSLVTTIPGALFRFLANRIERNPFICWQGKEAKRIGEDKKFTISSWNICCMVAGFSIGENLMPWAYRIDKIIGDIVGKGADVNCLYETFDATAAFYIKERLRKHGYNHFYFNIGSRAFGVSSGIMIASKYKVEDPEFTIFPKKSLLGATKFSSKGVFGFTLTSRNRPFARIHATHLQHSEVAQAPTIDEKRAREVQMNLISQKVQAYLKKYPNICSVVTGDLNLDDREFRELHLEDMYDKGDIVGPETFGGNVSQQTGPLNLDHTMALRGSLQSINSVVDDTNDYNPIDLQGEGHAPSDHKLLFTEIVLNMKEPTFL